MSSASSSTARTDVVSKRFVLAGFGLLAGRDGEAVPCDFVVAAEVGCVERRAVEEGARTSQIANQTACAANAVPRMSGDDQIQGVEANTKDGSTNGLSTPALPAR